MNLKLFNHIKLSSATPNNKIQILKFECPFCGVKDFYLCYDLDAIAWCYNCNETLYFKEMISALATDSCEKIIEFEIGKIRTKEEDAEFDIKLEQDLLQRLKEKYDAENK